MSIYLPTVFLAVPIRLLLPAFTLVLALPLFLFQTWFRVKAQLAIRAKEGRAAGPEMVP